MTEHNHRRGTRRTLPPSKAADYAAFVASRYFQGSPERIWLRHNARRGWASRSQLADVSVGAGVYGFTGDGHRGQARAVRGAKKFVRSRFRFHEKAATRRLAAADDLIPPHNGDEP